MSTEALPPQTNSRSEPSRRRYPRVLLPMLLIIGGALLLASNLGWLPWSFWESAWRLWPVLLILLGLEVILTGRGVWSAIVTAVVVVFLVGVIGAAVFIAAPWVSWGGPGFIWGSSSWNHSGPFGTLVSPSGQVVTEELELQDFNAVEAYGPFEVDVKRADSYRTALIVDDNLRDRIEISKQGQTLRLQLRNVSLTGRPTLRVEVAMPDLRRLQLSGATRGTIGGFKSSSELDLNVSGASSLKGEVGTGRMRLDASGASRVELSGSADELTMSISGATHFNMQGFSAATANVQMSGASGGELTVSERLDADLSGASWLSYYGNPSLGRIQTSGGSGLNRR